LCDGANISRTAYAELFAAYGTTWGVGDGSTTFAIPDLRNVFMMGAGSILPLGKSGGSRKIAVGNLPTHNHGVSDPGHGHAVGDPGHTHPDPGHWHGSNSGNWFCIDTGSPGYYVTDAGRGTKAVTFTQGSDTRAAGLWSSGTGIWIGGAGTGIGTNNTGNGDDYLPPAAGVHQIIRII
jgi:hypothetical protein